MTKYLIISILTITLTGCNNTHSNPTGNVNRLPNILIVTADDLAYNSVGAYGCKVPDITPNIDKLAEQGIRFTHAHVNTAVCQPCRQSLLTGRFPHNNGSEGFEPIDHDVSTLPEQLKSIGYVNGILGKEIHHQPVERFFWDYIPFKTEISGDATGGLTWRAMIKAAETDPEVARRVELFKYRVSEEFYHFKEDPDGLNNLANDAAYTDELKKFRKKMLEMMKKYNDPAYEAYKYRNQADVIEDFMEEQRIKAKNTKPVVRF